MQDKIFSLLGLAAKAGKVAAGGFSAEEAVKNRKARLVIIAADAQQNTVKKFTDKCTHYKVPFRFYGSKEELGRAVGRESRVCVAVTDHGLAQSILKKMTDGIPGAPDIQSVKAGENPAAARTSPDGTIQGEFPAAGKPPAEVSGQGDLPRGPLKGTGP